MIYVHVPFCRSFCTYCAFYSEIAGRDCVKAFDGYLGSLLGEIESRKEEISSPTEVDTLYIGGGTPSVLPLSVLGRIAGALKDLRPQGFSEFTVEVNPDDVTPSFAYGLKALGVNRVSVGIQSFDDRILRWMNRRHDSAGATETFRNLRDAGFGNISIDLIFGIPQLSESAWTETVRKAMALHPEHISAYQLGVDEGSALADLAAKGKWKEAPEEKCRAQYDTLCRELSFAGYHHYEISNFALTGFEAVHNGAYWRRIPYVGLGPGAHSFRRASGTEVRLWNSEELKDWKQDGEILSPEDIRTERIMLGLRTDRGMKAAELESLAGKEAVDALREQGALKDVPDADSARIRIPEDRFFVSDEIIRELI